MDFFADDYGLMKKKTPMQGEICIQETGHKSQSNKGFKVVSLFGCMVVPEDWEYKEHDCIRFNNIEFIPKSVEHNPKVYKGMGISGIMTDRLWRL